MPGAGEDKSQMMKSGGPPSRNPGLPPTRAHETPELWPLEWPQGNRRYRREQKAGQDAPDAARQAGISCVRNEGFEGE